ncbi:DegV family protein [Brevibacillus sp. SYSU BS000544]|uniref:DegV family protein n=1 Tax=Brevibacillus sp. SYSU BS000544 TaxID=3416443 RepID=UPI003CE464B1
MKQKKIAWITDSTVYLDKELLEKHHIHVVPLYVIFGETCYKEDVEITAPEFFERVKKTKELPKTSQPAVGDFVALYEKLKEEYEYGIAIHVASGTSGTFQSSLMAAEITGFNVQVIDSWMGAFTMASMIFEGMELEREGKSRDEIANYLRTIPPQIRSYIMVQDLELAHRGGRVSGIAYVLGSMLQIKPIVSYENSKIITVEKVRKAKKAKNRIFELFEDDAKSGVQMQVSIIHTNAWEDANTWKQELQETYPHLHFHVSYLGPIVGVHTGEGTIGLTWYKIDKPFQLQ